MNLKVKLMHLRKLEDKDAVYMLEWMTDPQINCYFRFDPDKVTIDTVMAFVRNAESDRSNFHLACADEDDGYLGTISLKSIDTTDKTAEYAVSFRKCAQGTGAAVFATYEILKIAFEEFGLNRVYLNVITSNTRAIQFYKKMNFVYEGVFRQHFFIRGKYEDAAWFSMLKGEYDAIQQGSHAAGISAAW